MLTISYALLFTIIIIIIIPLCEKSHLYKKSSFILFSSLHLNGKLAWQATQPYINIHTTEPRNVKRFHKRMEFKVKKI
jgi:hypothetical protein